MAQKKLLLILNIAAYICLFISITIITSIANNTASAFANEYADEDINPKINIRAEDQAFAQDLSQRSRKMSIEFIKEKWNELKKMQGFYDEYGEDIEDQIGDDFTDISLRIFVSSSMNIGLLKTYATEARYYNATLVFNGLPNDSWHDLAHLIEDITDNGDNPISAIIDDEAFKRFNIKTVPTFVLSKEEMFGWNGDFDNTELLFDKVTGNIGIKGALETFSKDGDLSDIADEYIDSTQVNKGGN